MRRRQTHYYSGPRSRKFWDRVNRANDYGPFYLLACTLQDLEVRLLQLLEAAEAKARGRKKR